MNKENTDKLLKFRFFKPKNKNSLIRFGFDCDDGWFELLYDLCTAIVIQQPPISFEVVQVKEKFGGLRFYVENSTPEIDKLINVAEKKSFNICEICGQPAETRSGSWLKTLCDEHAKDHNGKLRVSLAELRKLKLK